MPLPLAPNYPPLTDWKPGTVNIDRSLDQENADKINEDHNDIEFLGHGGYGVAYSTGDREPGSKVVKITGHDEEAQAAQYLLDHPAPCCIQIFAVDQIQQNPPFWKITSEKAIPLTPEEENVVQWCARSVSENINDGHSRFRLDSFNEVWKDMTDFSTRYKRVPITRELSTYCYQNYTGMLRCLEKHNLYTYDAHAKNIGKRKDGTFVLLDVGGIRESNLIPQ